ncbi:MAG: zinc-dependent alcohol dehydrogenase family protein [Proteobacteria bacterium]|nr:alcohol dehydrogenase [Pseudomonadota bacterium]NOG59440.1 zinc-dependent alcohol dehydrogenase family protein [Pseudomonadota bacterium]
MKAIQLSEYGGFELLNLTEIKTPEIKKPNHIKVRLKAAGINPVDTKIRSGAYPIVTFPAVLGCDGAGIIESCGTDVTKFKQGDEVYFFSGGLASVQGNYAEYKVLNQRFAAHKAKSQSFIEAAASPLVLLTAWEALFERAHLAKGQTVFINAGAGGVGHVAIQLAKYIGAKVCTTVSSKEKADFVKSLGADLIINYKEEDVEQAVMQWTEGKGVDVVLDNIGGPEIQKLFPLVRYYGELVTLLLPDNNIDWSVARFRNIRFSFEVMLSPMLFDLKEAQNYQTEILEQCAILIDEDKLKVHVSEVLSLEEAAIAHQHIEQGHTVGKIVLEI